MTIYLAEEEQGGIKYVPTPVKMKFSFCGTVFLFLYTAVKKADGAGLCVLQT